MSNRKRPPRSARSRNNTPRPAATTDRAGKPVPALKPAGAPSNRSQGLWLFGLHALTAGLGNPSRRRHRVIGTKQALENLKEALGEGVSPTPSPEIVDRSEVDAVCGPDSVHQGLAMLVDPLDGHHIEDLIAVHEGETDTIVVLDQATDPRNIGAVMRSARAFGARAVIVQDRNAPPETGTMAKAASGALEHVHLVRVTNLARAIWALKDANYWCMGFDGHADTNIADVDPSPKRAIVLGSEGAGLRRLTRETCDQLVKIPINEDAESLNLSNACAVALYEVTRKR